MADETQPAEVQHTTQLQFDGQPIDTNTVIQAAIEHYMADLTLSWEGISPELAQELYHQQWAEFLAVSTIAAEIQQHTAFLK